MAEAAILPGLALLLAELPLGRRSRILDVGANPLGAPPYAGLLAAKGCEVVGFEPNPEAFAALQASKSDGETYFPHAAGDGTRKELKLYRASGFTSLFEPDAAALRALGKRRWGRVVARAAQDTVALDAVAGLGPVDLVKIDIQGGELDVFRNARATLSGAVAVITEMRFFPIYDGEPLFGDIDVELRGQGFLLHKFLPAKRTALPNSQLGRVPPRRMADQLVDGDAVYVRDLRRVDDLPDDRLAQLALFAGGVFGSQSLCLMCLDALAARGSVADDLALRYAGTLPGAAPAEFIGQEERA